MHWRRNGKRNGEAAKSKTPVLAGREGCVWLWTNRPQCKARQYLNYAWSGSTSTSARTAILKSWLIGCTASDTFKRAKLAGDRPAEDVGPKQITYSSSKWFYLSESRFISNFTIVKVSKSIFLCNGRDGFDVSSAVSYIALPWFFEGKTCVPFFDSLFMEKTSRTDKRKTFWGRSVCFQACVVT